MRHEESPKNQTAIPSQVPGPWLQTQSSAPTLSGSQQLLLSENINKKILTNTEMDIRKYWPKRRKYWRKKNHCLEGSHKHSTLLQAVLWGLCLQAHAQLEVRMAHLEKQLELWLQNLPQGEGDPVGTEYIYLWRSEWAGTRSWGWRSV